MTGRPATLSEAQRIEVLVVRVHEQARRYSFGLLVTQVEALVRAGTAVVRPAEPPGLPGPVATLWHEGQWLPVYDLAQRLRLLAAWKMGVVTKVRPYLLIVRDSQGRQVALAVDMVSGIGTCALQRVLPLPAWLRRQLHPATIWAGLEPTDLLQSRQDTPTAAEEEPAPADPGGLLLLLLDCKSLLDSES